jgi:hypothetical protein
MVGLADSRVEKGWIWSRDLTKTNLGLDQFVDNNVQQNESQALQQDKMVIG